MNQQYYLVPMFAEKHYPELITPTELDAYLARGWYRMGQTIFTTHFLCFGRTFYSALWVRLPLEGYHFRKSLRKIIRKNQRHFRTEINRAQITPEKEKLYQRYRAYFSGMLAPSLKDSLLDGEEFNIFNTHEISVYDEDKLIALSYFDLGRESASSIIGIFHPDYDKYSLGFYTMLMEMDYSINEGFKYFYPGYVVPDYPRFDYKLRIGDVDYYDLGSKQWLPYSGLKKEDIPMQKMERRLGELQQYLNHHDCRSQKLYYPLFESNLFGFWHAPYFDFPIFLLCSPRHGSSHFLIVTFNPKKEAFQLLHCSLFDELQFYFNESYTQSFDKKFNFIRLLVVEEILAEHSQPASILSALGKRRLK